MHDGQRLLCQSEPVGGPPLPATNVGWGQEIDLDLQMASATCPNCNIRSVEATTASIANLGRAVDTAADILHANAISNSYGGDEFGSETSVKAHYNHPGRPSP